VHEQPECRRSNGKVSERLQHDSLILTDKQKWEDIMTRFALLVSTIIALPLLAPHDAQSAPATPADTAAIIGAASEDALSAFARRVGGAGGARTANVNRGANLNRNANINRNVNRNVNVNRNTNINRNIARVGVGVGVGGAALVRPWVRRPYYGTVIAGVALGTIIAASTIPPAPSSGLCWYWSNSSHTRGYWDYCQ
jgi:hypothetical protein